MALHEWGNGANSAASSKGGEVGCWIRLFAIIIRAFDRARAIWEDEYIILTECSEPSSEGKEPVSSISTLQESM